MPAKQIPLTPKIVNDYIKNILEGDNQLKKLYISGEASNVKYHTNGNIYFSIKDDQAQISCLMFKNYKNTMSEKIADGDSIEILGNIYTYTKMGQYNINVFKMRKVGLGDLYQKFVQLKNDLDKKGYFAKEHKKEIPKFPKVIGVITSPTGAAVRDVITTIKRRYKVAKIFVIPTLVQGSGAVEDICKSIEFADEIKKFDVLIVGRGGGSIEDLWSFNDERVAKIIYNSKTPIISAVGHETDFTISDFVADKRAPTPTAAAEIATPDSLDIQNRIKKNILFLNNNVKSIIDLYKNKIDNIFENQYFQNPLLNISNDFNYLNTRFINQVRLFKTEIVKYSTDGEKLNKELLNEVRAQIITNQKYLIHQKEQLDNLNPLSILSKGYSTVQKDDLLIKSVLQVVKNDKISINMNDGKIIANIEEIIKE